MNTLRLPATADLLLLYPQQSLSDQMNIWAGRHPQRLVETSFQRSLPEIRKLLRYAGAAIVDATADPALAIDAFLQGVARMGPEAVAVYTEALHDGLELFVRVRGSLFLLGPLFDEQWEEFFDRWLHAREMAPVAVGSRRRRSETLPVGHYDRQQAIYPIHRFRARFDWPYNDFQ